MTYRFLCCDLTSLSGGRGIRTPGGVTLNSFQDCRIRPLCHSSSNLKRVLVFNVPLPMAIGTTTLPFLL